MPLVQNFKSTTVWNAFLLNSLATTAIVFAAIMIKTRLDRYVDYKGRDVTNVSDLGSTIITLVATFIAALAVYVGLHYIFGFGDGMLIC